MAIPYFCLGYLIKQESNSGSIIVSKITSIFNKTFSKIAIIIFTVLLLICIYKTNGLIQMNMQITEKLQNKSLLLAYLGGISGTLLVVMISKFFKLSNDFVDTISKNTLFIIFSHFLLLFIFAWCKFTFIVNYCTNSMLATVYALLISFTILIINYYVIKILQKHCQIVLGKYLPTQKTSDIHSIYGGG